MRRNNLRWSAHNTRSNRILGLVFAEGTGRLSTASAPTTPDLSTEITNEYLLVTPAEAAGITAYSRRYVGTIQELHVAVADKTQ